MTTAHWPPAAKRAAARSDWLLVGAIVVYLLANLPFLVAWPAVNGDEGREANAFWVASGVDPSAQTLDPVFQHVLAFGSAISTQSPLSTQTGYMSGSDRTNVLIIGYGGGSHDGANLT